MERKNRCLEEMARIILNESLLPKSFWIDAINIASYILNRVLIKPILRKTPHELYFERKLNVSHFYMFCYNIISNLNKNEIFIFTMKKIIKI